MIFRDEFVEADGDLTRAIARCLVCERPRDGVRGDAFEVEVECRHCITDDTPRDLRCPACNRHLCDLSLGLRAELTVRCDKCDTLVSVRRRSPGTTCVSVKRPSTGRIALRFGIKPSTSRPAMPALSARRTSCAT